MVVAEDYDLQIYLSRLDVLNRGILGNSKLPADHHFDHFFESFYPAFGLMAIMMSCVPASDEIYSFENSNKKEQGSQENLCSFVKTL